MDRADAPSTGIQYENLKRKAEKRGIDPAYIDKSLTVGENMAALGLEEGEATEGYDEQAAYERNLKQQMKQEEEQKKAKKVTQQERSKAYFSGMAKELQEEKESEEREAKIAEEFKRNVKEAEEAERKGISSGDIDYQSAQQTKEATEKKESKEAEKKALDMALGKPIGYEKVPITKKISANIAPTIIATAKGALKKTGTFKLPNVQVLGKGGRATPTKPGKRPAPSSSHVFGRAINAPARSPLGMNLVPLRPSGLNFKPSQGFGQGTKPKSGGWGLNLKPQHKPGTGFGLNLTKPKKRGLFGF